MTTAFRRFKLSPLLEERICLMVRDCLQGKYKAVMEYRMGFGIDRGLTHEEIGELMGVTKQHISDLEEQAIAHIIRACRQANMEDLRKTFKTKIEWLELPTRPHNCLIGAGIIFVEQLCQYTVIDLTTIQGLGKSAIAMIERKLRVKGKKLLQIPSVQAASKLR